MKNIIRALKSFIKKEYSYQNKEILAVWEKPLETRVAQGEAIAKIKIDRYTGNRLVLECLDGNLSKFRVGDRVRLSTNQPKMKFYTCEIEEEDGNVIEVSARFAEDLPDLQLGAVWTLDKDIVGLKDRACKIIDELKSNDCKYEYFKDLVQGKIFPNLNSSRKMEAEKLVKTLHMDCSQEEAFIFSYATENFYLIQGPPGTGKTYVLSYLARQLAEEGECILITAVTHRAINNALNMISRETGYRKILKVGRHNRAGDLKGIRNYVNLKNSNIKSDTKGIIIGATPHADLADIFFDTVIFDESGQLTLPLAIPGILSGTKHIFIGDHQQMGPVIQCDHKDEWLKKSIFETLFQKNNGTVLKKTYRMNEAINKFPSKYFYKNMLTPTEDARTRTLSIDKEPIKFPILLSPHYPEIFLEVFHTGNTIRSKEEADIVADLVEDALNAGLSVNDIAVITPYRAQARLIRAMLHSKNILQTEKDDEILMVDTVERIQGQEKEMIIISLTTSDPEYAKEQADFYFKPNRLNVAITRAKTKRIVIGSPCLFDVKDINYQYQQWVGLFHSFYQESTRMKLP